MKLQKKNTKYLLLYLPVVFLVCTVIFFILLSIQTIHLHNEHLLLKQQNILHKIEEQKSDLEPNSGVVGEYTIREITSPTSKKYDRVKDTIIYYSSHNEYLPFKMQTGIFIHNGKQYEITTYSSSATLAAIAGAYIGNKLLKKVTLRFLQVIVAVMLLLLSVVLGAGFI